MQIDLLVHGLPSNNGDFQSLVGLPEGNQFELILWDSTPLFDVIPFQQYEIVVGT